jgi:O-antigen/teichoic acid export membrane protein
MMASQIGLLLLVIYAIYVFIKSKKNLDRMKSNDVSEDRKQKSSYKFLLRVYIGLIGSAIMGLFFAVLLLLIVF